MQKEHYDRSIYFFPHYEAYTDHFNIKRIYIFHFNSLVDQGVTSHTPVNPNVRVNHIGLSRAISHTLIRLLIGNFSINCSGFLIKIFLDFARSMLINMTVYK